MRIHNEYNEKSTVGEFAYGVRFPKIWFEWLYKDVFSQGFGLMVQSLLLSPLCHLSFFADVLGEKKIGTCKLCSISVRVMSGLSSDGPSSRPSERLIYHRRW